MKLDALDHPKTLDFAARLNVELPTALGHLELLWAFTGKKAPQGNIGKWPDGAIARACYWMGDPKCFLQSLLQSGFLDADPEHRYVIHDWHEHAPRWVRAKLAKLRLPFMSTTGRTAVATTEGTSDEDDEDPDADVASVVRTTVATAGAPSKGSEGKGREEKTREVLTARTHANGEGKGKEGIPDDQHDEPPPTEPASRQLTPQAAMAIPLREAGVKVTSHHPTLVAWVAAGYTPDQVLGAVAIARESLGEEAEINAKYLDKVLRDPKNWPKLTDHTVKPGTGAAPGRAFVTVAKLEDDLIARSIAAGMTDDEIAALPDLQLTANVRVRIGEARGAGPC